MPDGLAGSSSIFGRLDNLKHALEDGDNMAEMFCIAYACAMTTAEGVNLRTIITSYLVPVASVVESKPNHASCY